jgi:glyoxylase-like metal-dependent hydrolase (beta-lactamase superfamily II)
VVIDTLPFPTESSQVRDFALRRCPRGIRYLVNTHHHADHIYGSYLFPEAELIAHRSCREILLRVGQESLEQAQAQTPALAPVRLRIPQLVFEDDLILRLGEKTLHFMHAPGHSSDGVIVHIREDRVLVASDVLTPVPLVARGNPDQLIQSLRLIKTLNLENTIQGHGGVLLRGEIDETVDSNIAYLRTIRKKVGAVVEKAQPRSALDSIEIETSNTSTTPWWPRITAAGNAWWVLRRKFDFRRRG